MDRSVARGPRVAILINNPYVADSRAWKMATSLAGAGYDVTVVAREGEGLPEREGRDGHHVLRVAQPRPLPWLPVPRLPGDRQRARGPASRVAGRLRDTVGRGMQAGRYLLLTRAWVRAIAPAVGPADLWQAESIITLPLAVALRDRFGGVAVYDANDIDTESGRFARLPASWRRLLKRRERSLARRVDALLTVSEPYASLLAESLGRPVDAIVRNGPTRHVPSGVNERRFHDRFGLPDSARVVLYLGQVMAGRGLEQLFEAIGLVDDAVLVVAGFGTDYEQLRGVAADLPHAQRIRFMEGVAPAEIPAWNAAADVAAMPVQPDTVNHRYNTPTKLFDAMGVGVPVVASDLPGIRPIVTATGCGELCDPSDPADIARVIRQVLDAPPPERAAYRRRCLAAAGGEYGWDHQTEILIGVYERLGVPPPDREIGASCA